jgi:hypothetical protein
LFSASNCDFTFAGTLELDAIFCATSAICGCSVLSAVATFTPRA